MTTYTTPDSATGLQINTTEPLKVFPTIFKNQINIRSDQPLRKITVYNQLGRQIRQIKPESQNAVVSFYGMPAGMYLVKADKNPAVKVFKQ
jgi:hypothetical protein